MKQIEKKKEKNSKKNSPTKVCLFSFVRLSLTNPIKSSSFNLFRVLSLSLCALLSRTTTPALFSKALLGVLFCSAKSFVTVFTAVILLNDDERERDIYHTHRRRRSTNVATTDDDERTISKSKVGTVLRAL